MLRPPQHRADAPIQFVHEDDEAWDKDRINAEIAKIGKRKAQEHPFVRYLSGATRFDLSAEMDGPVGERVKITDYFDVSVATIFVLKRLSWRQIYTLQPMIGGGNYAGAYALACRWALERIDGPPCSVKIERSDDMLTEDTMQALFDLLPGLPTALGAAAFAASLPLSEPEKKP